jgi:hypothetical protein
MYVFINQVVIRGDKPIGSMVHMYMETPQGNSMNNYLYLKQAKMSCFSFSLFSSAKSENWMVEQVLPRGGGRERWQGKRIGG